MFALLEQNNSKHIKKMMIYKHTVVFWKESGWQGRKANTETWVASSKEELFLKMLKTNNHIQKNFDPDKMNADCYRFADDDWQTQEEYDEWWKNLGEERREEIFEQS